MAKAKLSAGTELDVVSGPEAQNYTRGLYTGLVGYLEDLNGSTEVIPPMSFTTDGSGNGSGTAYEVPVGYRAFLLRLGIDFEGSVVATPVTCSVRVVSDDDTPSALRALNNNVPSVYETGRSQAPIFQGGQRVVVVLAGAAATTKYTTTGQVLLVPVQRRPVPDPLIPPAGG